MRLQVIDKHWHPFTISSAPSANCLEFCIEGRGENSWTSNLWNYLDCQPNHVFFEIVGPYGISFAKSEGTSHVIAIGSGTGIVPMLSMFSQHVSSLLALDPTHYLKERRGKIGAINKLYADFNKTEQSFSDILFGNNFHSFETPDDDSSQDFVQTSYSRDILNLFSCVFDSIENPIQNYAQNEIDTLSRIRKKVKTQINILTARLALSLIPILSIATLFISISWNALGVTYVEVEDRIIYVEPLSGMKEILLVCNLLIQGLFILETLHIRPAMSMFTLLDWSCILFMIFFDWYWIQYDLWCDLDSNQSLYYALLVGYISLRSWGAATDFSNDFFTKVPQHIQVCLLISVNCSFHLFLLMTCILSSFLCFRTSI